ncbi:MAG: hypothetical protein QW117_02670 [Candidatus Pacearchaeota archaeon]
MEREKIFSILRQINENLRNGKYGLESYNFFPLPYANSYFFNLTCNDTFCKKEFFDLYDKLESREKIGLEEKVLELERIMDHALKDKIKLKAGLIKENNNLKLNIFSNIPEAILCMPTCYTLFNSIKKGEFPYPLDIHYINFYKFISENLIDFLFQTDSQKNIVEKRNHLFNLKDNYIVYKWENFGNKMKNINNRENKNILNVYLYNPISEIKEDIFYPYIEMPLISYSEAEIEKNILDIKSHLLRGIFFVGNPFLNKINEYIISGKQREDSEEYKLESINTILKNKEF